MEQKESYELLNVTADCKKKKCDCKYNSAECKLRYFTASCTEKALKQNKEKAAERENK